jgi:hypothetical protein
MVTQSSAGGLWGLFEEHEPNTADGAETACELLPHATANVCNQTPKPKTAGVEGDIAVEGTNQDRVSYEAIGVSLQQVQQTSLQGAQSHPSPRDPGAVFAETELYRRARKFSRAPWVALSRFRLEFANVRWGATGFDSCPMSAFRQGTDGKA